MSASWYELCNINWGSCQKSWKEIQFVENMADNQRFFLNKLVIC